MINSRAIKIFRTEKQFRVEIRFLKRDFVFYAGKAPLTITFGITNETKDNYFIPFIDYDNIYFEKVLKDVKHIQAVFDLSDFIVLKTEEEKDEQGREFGNYHCICFDKCTFQEILEILSHTRCDPNYRRAWKFYKSKNWVLRIEKKYYSRKAKDEPKLKCIIPNKPRIPRKCSYAHYLALSKWYSLPKLNLEWDGITECELIQYNTV